VKTSLHALLVAVLCAVSIPASTAVLAELNPAAGKTDKAGNGEGRPNRMQRRNQANPPAPAPTNEAKNAAQ
jgi:hypothetical protein